MKDLNPKINAGLELISALGATELKPIEIRDLLYDLVTKNFSTIDEIIKIAQEKKKLLQLTEKTYLLTPEGLKSWVRKIQNRKAGGEGHL